MSVACVAKSSKGCWTCKRRKIGCDKRIPSCSNCQRTNRKCHGYGVRLSWPEDGDGRRPDTIPWRRSSDDMPSPLNDSSYRGSVYFLNTMNEDLVAGIKTQLTVSKVRWDSCPTSFSFSPSTSLHFGYEANLRSHESVLLSYYTDVLSRMITTVDDANNGFRTTLLPVALLEANHASSSLRQAVFALSAYHLWGHDAAVKFKLSAIKQLSLSLQNDEDAALPQFATSMMLCIGDVFDSADGSWPKHLAAAKALSTRLRGDESKDLLFLQTLLEYHDVLKGFSVGRHTSVFPDSSQSIVLPRESKDDTIIIGALGCSRELMSLIAVITHLHNHPTPLPHHLHALPSLVQTRLENLVQTPNIALDAQSGHLDYLRIHQTAEIYRLAALIYLYTSISPLPRSSSELQSLVSRSLGLLESFAVCTSPWPLFVTALEVNNDSDRIRVLHVLEIMQTVRRISNIDVLQRVIEAVWKRTDLNSDVAGNSEERVNWREFFDLSGRLPSFI